MFVPTARAIDAVQFAVPLAVPDPPRLLTHVTPVTPTLSPAEPPIPSVGADAVYAEFVVGDVMVTLGAVVSGGGTVGAAAAIAHANPCCVVSTPSNARTVTE